MVGFMPPFSSDSIPWAIASGPTALPPGDLHLWLADRDVWTNHPWDSVLSAEELARTSRYRYAVDRDRARTGRGLLRRLLGRYLGMSPADVAIERGEFGKPQLTGDSNDTAIAFNASGSAHLALFAFARGAAVGVDIEAFAATPGAPGKALPSPRDIRSMTTRFAADEAALIRGLPEADAAAAFLRLWTCKEACLKCRGTGLQTPLDEIRIELLDDTRAIGLLGTERFAIRTFAPFTGATVAVAMVGNVMPEPRCWTLARQ
jgi:4'-phosphopantetheinyl transferase